MAVAQEQADIRLSERIRVAVQTRTMLWSTLAAIFVVWIAVSLAADVSAGRIISLIAWGVMLGGVIGLGGIGLTLTYGVLKFPNFSHGALVSLGAYLTFAVVDLVPNTARIGPFSFGWEFVLGIVIGAPIVGVVCLAIDRVMYRPLRSNNASLVLFAMASLAMAFFVRSIVYMIWSGDFRFYYPGRSSPALDLPLGIRVQADQLFILLLAGVLVAAVYLLLEYTKMGKAMRATANNPELARVRGINTERVIAYTWMMAGALATAGGAMYGLSSQLRPAMGFWLLLPMFAAVIMGSIGNPRGALVGALIIGVATQLSTSLISPAYGPAVAFVLLIITIVIRPQGLLGAPGE